LGSGSVQTTATHPPPCSKGVEGPNECGSNTTINAQPGDPDLDTLSGQDTLDAPILEFDFVPQFGTVQFSYVFSSDEYNEYVNAGVNDSFGFFVNGQNCALVPGTNQPVTIDTINLGSNSQYFRDNTGNTIDTEMDGLTTVLTCDATVNAGQTNHLKLAIADAGDYSYDSNVFIEAGSLVSGTQITTSLSGAGQSGENITVPAGTTVTDSATLSGANSGTAGGTVTYTVYSDSACLSVFASGGTKTVTNGTVPNSDPVTFAQSGTFYWVASYSGDATHNASSSGCGSETVTVTGGQSTVTLAPPTATNTVGQQHCVTATVKDAQGNAAPDVTVDFTVSGANSTTGTATTNASGEGTFCYTGQNSGQDTINAVANTGNNPTATASKTWTAQPTGTPCKVTGGGQITAANSDKASFGGNAHPGTPPKGQLHYADHGPATPIKVNSISVLSITCSADGTQATITGKATVNGQGSFDYRIDVKDLGEPGKNDTYRIRLSNGYDSGTQTLKGGNIQIHKK
jgi:hypothetical protein